MIILAIETSCDETAIALLDITGPREAPDIEVLANALYSQSHLHAEYGGVYPNLAKREHIKNLPILLRQIFESTKSEARNPKQTRNSSFENSNLNTVSDFDIRDSKLAQVDHIAVTQGPGLEPALWAGINFAQELGERWGKPVVGVDHMEGHIWSVLYRDPTIFNSQFSIFKGVKFPILALLVSGGHTELVLVKGFGEYEILGKTRDDAVGEAFDKVARMLGLGYPGGPKISALAEIARINTNNTQINTDINPCSSVSNPRLSVGKFNTIKFPRPMIDSGDLDFSYSGLKTAVLYKIKELGELTEESKREIACAFEDAAIEVLVKKTGSALDQYPEVKTLIVGGGVSANTYLIQNLKELAQSHNLLLLTPARELSTDNAIMIGIASYIKQKSGQTAPALSTDIKAKGNLSLNS